MKNKELPKRKPNRRKMFDYSSNGAYFITICTKNRVQSLSNIVGDAPSTSRKKQKSTPLGVPFYFNFLGVVTIPER